MAAILPAITVAQDRRRDERAPRDRSPSSSVALASPGPIDVAPSSAGSRATKSPTSSDGRGATGNSISSTTTTPVAAASPTFPNPASSPPTAATATSASGRRTPFRRNTDPPKKDAAQAAASSASASAAAGAEATGSARATPPSAAAPAGPAAIAASAAAAAAAIAAPPSPASSAAIDPLSQHIFTRTNTDHFIPSRLRNPNRPESPIDGGPARVGSDPSTKHSIPGTDAGRERRKGVSFLSRLSMRGYRKRDDDFNDGASQLSDQRTDGTNARVFSSIIGGGGYIPHHKEPPRYIRTKASNKKVREFDHMFLAQELVGTRPSETDADDRAPMVTISTPGAGRKRMATGGAIWATEFSRDGRYLAAGGHDKVVRVWAVISTPEDRRAQEEEEAANGGTGERLSAPVFVEKPFREFVGHTGEILDLSWSKNNFILSTSMDKTVRLWHISRQECLCTFKHKELVSKVVFHPRDDRFFLAGCLDAMLRLWSIPDKAVAYSAQLPEMITAVAFTPDGKTAMAGMLNGLCHFYETDTLKFQTQIHVRSSRGKNSKGSKITGIDAMVMPDSKDGDTKVLITSTDSRIRVYNLRDRSLDAKFKGHEHTCSQIAASFSDDGKYVICGSEDRKAFIWNVSLADAEASNKRPYESFDAHGDIVTTAIFAPTRTRQLLGGSGDPIYDLCNPPPVTLMSMEESTASQTALSDHQSEIPVQARRPEESPAYIARSTHYDGNILVTTDDMGIIKVFRQDCAYLKRKHESWETGSTFSRKLTTGSGILGRSASIVTRNSGGSIAARSRRGSLSQMPLPSIASGTPSLVSSPLLGNSDRILSWRQGIENGGRPVSMASIAGTPTRSERSVSPNKASRTPLSSAANLASEARKQPYAAASNPPTPHASNNSVINGQQTTKGSINGNSNNYSSRPPTSPASSTFSTPRQVDKIITTPPEGLGRDRIQEERDEPSEPAEPAEPPMPSFSFKPAEGDDQLRLDPAGASYSFWNLNKWKGIASLRASLSGTSGGGGPGSGHGPHARSPSETSAASPGGARGGEHPGHSASPPTADKEKLANGAAARRKSMGASVLPKSPLSKTDTVSQPYLSVETPDTADAPPTDASRRHTVQVASLLRTGSSTAGVDADNDNGGRSHLFPPPGGRLSPYTRDGSIVSRLSSELTSDEGGDTEGEEMRCRKCGGREFKARRAGSRQKLLCVRCGRAVDED